MQEEQRETKAGDVGVELTGLVMDASVLRLMQYDSQRHVDLTGCSQTHRSFLSLTSDRVPYIHLAPLLHHSFFSSFIPFYHGWITDLPAEPLDRMGVDHMATMRPKKTQRVLKERQK